MKGYKGYNMRIFGLLSNIIGVYTVVLWFRVIITWLPSQRDPYHTDGPFISFLKSVTDPFLNLFRSSRKRGVVDLSVLWAFMMLNILQSVFSVLAQTGNITVWVVAVLLLDGIWSYFVSFVIVLLCIVLVVRLICGRFPGNPRCAAFLSAIDPVIRKPVNFVAAIMEFFVRKRRISDQTFVFSALVFYVVLYFALRHGIGYLIDFLIRNKT